MTFRKYDEAFILDALRKLKENNGNAYATSKELGIHYNTLAKWEKKHSEENLEKVYNDKKRRVLKSTEELVDYDVAVLSETIKAKNLAVKRAIELIPKEEDLNKISNILKTLHLIQSGEDIDKPQNNITFYQKIEQQLISMQNGKPKGKL